MKLQFESHQDFVAGVEELTRSSITYMVHVRDKTIRIIVGEVRKDTIKWLSELPRVKVFADSD